MMIILTTSAQLHAAGEELVELAKADPTILIELKYATSDNLMKEPLYPAGALCYLRPKVAERLIRVQKALRVQKLGLKVFDGYRPLSVQKRMFERFPMPGYVMDPKKGSNHNRGAAVDLTLVDANGKELPMPSAYDEFTERAHTDYAGGPADARENRRILQEAMTAQGFKSISTEWWHFDDTDAKSYSLLDVPIQDLH